jgi:hypothetical protein
VQPHVTSDHALQYNRYKKHDPTIMALATVQSYVVLAVILAIFVRAPNWPCEAGTHIVFFRKFSATGGGRMFGIVGTVLLLVAYTVLVYLGYAKRAKAAPKAAANSPEPSTSRTTVPHRRARPTSDTRGFKSSHLNGRVVVTSATIVLITALAVGNTELLRYWNGVTDGDDWGFGQFLALALAALPGWQTARAFIEHGLGPPRRKTHRRGVRVRHEHELGPAPSSALPSDAQSAGQPSMNESSSDSEDEASEAA